MMTRWLTHRDGSLRQVRFTLLLGAAFVCAFASIPALILVGDVPSDALRFVLSLFLVLGAKLPFLLLIFWLMQRMMHATPQGLAPEQVQPILDQFNADPRPEHVAQAWWVADQAPDGPLKARAVETALRLTAQASINRDDTR